MEYKNIKLEFDDGIATLTFDRPKVLNAFNLPMTAETLHAIERIGREKSARVLVLTGGPCAFSSGADLSGGSMGVETNPLDSHFNPLIERIAELSIPVISAVAGPAAGVGCSTALAADICIAARSAYFLQAFANIGLVPDGGSTWLLPRLIGKARATAMMMLAERIPAEKAEAWGLIYCMVEDDDLYSTVNELARKLADGPTLAFSMIRSGIRDALQCSRSDGLQIERRNQMLAIASEDHREGVKAFLRKRKAVFHGC